MPPWVRRESSGDNSHWEHSLITTRERELWSGWSILGETSLSEPLACCGATLNSDLIFLFCPFFPEMLGQAAGAQKHWYTVEHKHMQAKIQQKITSRQHTHTHTHTHSNVNVVMHLQVILWRTLPSTYYRANKAHTKGFSNLYWLYKH